MLAPFFGRLGTWQVLHLASGFLTLNSLEMSIVAKAVEATASDARAMRADFVVRFI